MPLPGPVKRNGYAARHLRQTLKAYRTRFICWRCMCWREKATDLCCVNEDGGMACKTCCATGEQCRSCEPPTRANIHAAEQKVGIR